jgi:hypothetical protein
MSNSTGPIKLLARRFASLSPAARMKISEKLLRWREENEEAIKHGKTRAGCSCLHQTSLLEKFWDEVEAAHGDGLYPANPFAVDSSHPLLYAAQESLLQRPAC